MRGWWLAFAILTASACGDGAAAPADAGARDAAFDVVCANGDPVTLTGTTPRGSLDGLRYLNVVATTGFCNVVTLAFTAEPAYGAPVPAPILQAHIDLEVLEFPLAGTLGVEASYADAAGPMVETTGRFEASLIEAPAVGSRVRGRLIVDTAPWSIDVAIDATICHRDTCF